MADTSQLLPLLAPDFYAKMLPIERRQQMAQALMQGGMGQAQGAYGGLANAGKMIAGALLGRSADTGLANLYSSGGPEGGQSTGQVSNGVTPETQDAAQDNSPTPQLSQMNLSPGISPDTQGAPTQGQKLSAGIQSYQPASAETSRFGFKVIPELGPRGTDYLALTDFGKYSDMVQKEFGPTEAYRNALIAANGDPQKAQQLVGTQFETEAERNAKFAAGAPGVRGTPQQLAAIQQLPPELKGPAMQYGLDSPQFQQIAQGWYNKNNAISLRAPVLVNGQITQGAENGVQPTYTGTTATGSNQVPGYAQARANIEGAVTGAQQLNTPQNIVTPEGAQQRVWGSALGTPPFMQYPMPGANAPQGAPAQAPRPVASAPIPQGQTSANAAMAPERAALAKQDVQVQASGQALLGALDRLNQINALTPGSAFMSPEVKAELAKRGLGPADAAKYVAMWKQTVETGVMDNLNAFKAAAGGRLSAPVLNEIEKANGIDVDLPPSARAGQIAQLRGLINEGMSASHNALSMANKPGLMTDTSIRPGTPPTGYGDAAPRRIRRYNQQTGQLE